MKWHHSLYWRIAVGFVACLALLLFVQAMLFVWVVSRSTQTIPNQPPDRFAQTIALDVTQALERDPALDIREYLQQEYARDAQPFFVLLQDGGTIEMNGSFPESMIHESRQRFEGLLNGTGRSFGRGDQVFPPTRPFDGRPFGARRRVRTRRTRRATVSSGADSRQQRSHCPRGRPAGTALFVSPAALRAHAWPRRLRDADCRSDSSGRCHFRAGEKASPIGRGRRAPAGRRRPQRSRALDGPR